MRNRWSEQEASEYVARCGAEYGEALALRTYSARLLGAEPGLVLHGGGNTSAKGVRSNALGEKIPAIFVKASGHDLATIEPEGHCPLDLGYLKRLRGLSELTDEAMVNELRSHMFDARAATPSVEALAHVFLSPKYIDHTHADAILALTNQIDGEERVREALGEDVILLPYVKPGFGLARAAVAAFEAQPGAYAMVWMHHGLVTWGETARESYDATIELVTRAEEYLARAAARPLIVSTPTDRSRRTDLATAQERVGKVAPVLRGLLAAPSGDADRPHRRIILRPLVSREALDFVDWDRGRAVALTAPLTSDHLIRTKPLPLWVDSPQYDDLHQLREQLRRAVAAYCAEYDAYVERHAARLAPGVNRFDPLPRVVLLPGLGAFCAGRDAGAADIVRDITAQTLATKAQIAAIGDYQGLAEAELFDMEYWSLQHAKLPAGEPPLGRQIALVTGAAGAIGWGICKTLIEHGCHVAATDISQENLDRLVGELRPLAGAHGEVAQPPSPVIGVPMDVTDPASVAQGFAGVIRAWGGVDLVVLNAGVALVSSLAEMDIEAFRRLQRVNVEGTLLVLAEAARHFELQGTGGDIVLVSTKNVFAPGARFGAYSATKAAAHQLARIASLELAALDVRVNMVAPDAVFAGGAHKSGLWAAVGPDRMRARGLDQAGLEEYYRSRNLLKARVTAEHVGRAVLYFATRQTPTTGATIPVDGGLPDATPH
ncbi:MAG TPA: bifunctional aldolase/short-chain dehydrogenase [Armatimonadota bacterium]|nr:bifunctional aldolase/short-chain dehydrogenase [Armatimonadota bacterium]